jgi:hypothetical protein
MPSLRFGGEKELHREVVTHEDGWRAGVDVVDGSALFEQLARFFALS